MILKTLICVVYLFGSFNWCWTQEWTAPHTLSSHPELELYLEQYKKEVEQKIPKEYNKKQKTYLKTNVEGRYKASLNMIKNGQLVNSGFAYQVVDSLFQLVIRSNPNLSQYKYIFIYNSRQVNAFTMGDHVIYLHLGLLHRVTSYEELLFVICHEIAHNELNHFEIKTLDYVEHFLNEDLESAVKEAFKSDYGQVTALNNIYLPWILANRKNSRQYETDADELAFTLLGNCLANKEKAFQVYYLFEYADLERDIDTLDLIKGLGIPAEIDVSRHLNYKEETSSLGKFRKKEDTLRALLTTHPFPMERKQFFEEKLHVKVYPVETYAPEFKPFRHHVDRDLILQALLTKKVGRSIFHHLHFQQNFPGDSTTYEQFVLAFTVLMFEKYNRRSGLILANSYLEMDENYARTLQFLKKLSPDECYELCTHYLYYLPEEGESIYRDYAQALYYGIKKDFGRFVPLYKKLEASTKDFPYFGLIKEVYTLNRVNIDKL